MSLLEKQWYIQVPWGRISIIAWGDCHNPPVLLCHGHMDSAVTFRPLIKRLPQDFYYIGMDIPGHGKSDRFPPGLLVSLYDLTYSIEAVARHFRWENFILIGHSMGSVLGLSYDISYPGKLTKLILLDPINLKGIPPNMFSKWYKKYYVEFFENYDKYNLPKERGAKHKRSEVIDAMMKKRSFKQEMAEMLVDSFSEDVGDGLIRYTFDPRNKLMHGWPFTSEHMRKIFTGSKTPIVNIVTEDSLNAGLFNDSKFLVEENSYPRGNFRVRSVPGNHDAHIIDPVGAGGLVTQFLLYGLEGMDSKAKL